MLFVFIGFLLILYSLISFRRAFIFYLVYQIFWYAGAPLLVIGGRALPLSVIMNFYFMIMYILKYNNKSTAKIRFPIYLPLLGIMLSNIFSCFTAAAGVGSEAVRAINNILQQVVLVWLIWNNIEEENEFKLFFKSFSVVMFLAALLGIMEFSVGSNFLFNYKSGLAPLGITNYNEMEVYAAVARGYRILSCFEHPIGAGMTFGLYIATSLAYLTEKDHKKLFDYFVMVTMVLCIPCVILTKMRGPIVFTAILILGVFKFNIKRFFKTLLIMLPCVAVGLNYFKEYSYLITSIFDSQVQSQISGSSYQMRIEQLIASINAMKLSPLFGLGEMVTSTNYLLPYKAQLRGMESLWFEQLVRHGFFGVVVYICFIYITLVKLPLVFKSRELFFFGLAYWFTYTLSSVPSFRMPIFYVILFYFIKTSQVYKNNKESITMRKKVKIRIGTLKIYI